MTCLSPRATAATPSAEAPAGATPGFLADLPLTVLDQPPLVDLLKRLDIPTSGAFAALPSSDVLARFGLDAAIAHRLAGGRDDRPLEVRTPPVDLAVCDTYDEPLERVDVAAFAARTLAVRLYERLTGHGLACTRLEIGAVTTDGQELSRVWRHDGLLTAHGIADRTRWQLDGWLTRRRLAAAITTLVLTPHGVVRQARLQAGLWVTRAGSGSGAPGTAPRPGPARARRGAAYQVRNTFSSEPVCIRDSPRYRPRYAATAARSSRSSARAIA
ncbi:hypothetical protein Acy02nite_91820 [Actinoplanes cyaneus]|uniref:Uncharacterized protein n=1 Tax=Actinoplanes cyaneus TaxID=52696 RepID=A0A919MHI0_9ACTN|nr:hypothetical protein [Actinoplanes cyaneus]MCW2144577.1 hypothetical protein [Actinoplanes cyaneus]GID71301.1 hypothetical protein Acy02nite_91820 [Actinoplanes cyaneus]